MRDHFAHHGCWCCFDSFSAWLFITLALQSSAASAQREAMDCEASSDPSSATPAPNARALLAVKWQRSMSASERQPSNGASSEPAIDGNNRSFGNSSPWTNTSLHEVIANDNGSHLEKKHGSYAVSSGLNSHGGDLSSSAWVASAVQPESYENGSVAPLTQDRFDSFGYPGAGLLLELHMPKVTLGKLHSSDRASLADFLLEVRGELGKAANVQEPRISILGILGRYTRPESGGYSRVHSLHSRASDSKPRIDEEVVVRFEILPGWSNDTDPREALNVLQDQLSSQSSVLMSGPLGTILDNATISLSTPAGLAAAPRGLDHHGIGHTTVMAWPIGISAAFVGVLIWLAAH